MPIDVKYDQQLKIIQVKLSGRVSLLEIDSTLAETLSDPNIPSDSNALCDVSELEFANITIDYQRELIQIRKQNEAARGDAKVAILCTYTLAEPLVKLYTILSQ